MNEVVDGEYQKYTRRVGRLHPRALLRQVPGAAGAGRAPHRRAAAQRCAAAATTRRRSTPPTSAAVEHQGAPTVILAKTIKGYGLGEAGEGRNVTHQQKKLNEDELRHFRDRFDIPIPDDRPGRGAVLPPAGGQRGDPLPARAAAGARRLRAVAAGRGPRRSTLPAADALRRTSSAASAERECRPPWPSCRCSAKLLQGQGARRRTSCRSSPTRRAPSAWRRCSAQCGIYSSVGQLYEPVDAKMLLYYKEAKDGQILEEGITEAGSMASFIAAGTAYADARRRHDPVLHLLLDVRLPAHRRPDLGRRRLSAARGFLLGATAGRTTLNGEGLQHQDGHSHVLAATVPNLLRLRSGLRLRDRGDRPRRPPPDVRRARGRLLLPHPLQRELRDAGDAGGGGGGDPPRAVPASAGGRPGR